MEVILVKDVEKLGYVDDIVNVKPGYANNFLIPQGFAKSATASAKKILAENIKQRAHKESKVVEDAEMIAAKISAITLTISVKAKDGKIFGSVTPADIAEALDKKGISIDRKSVTVENIKSLGEYEATVRVYKTVAGSVKLNVINSAEPAEKKDAAEVAETTTVEK